MSPKYFSHSPSHPPPPLAAESVWATSTTTTASSVVYMKSHQPYPPLPLPSQALGIIMGKISLVLMDSSLEGKYVDEDDAIMIELASKCLQYEARDRPDIKFLFTALDPLQKEENIGE
ncbi:serine/threonine-protein kinase BSK2 [Spinacia oleracea]|uniref:Serine/threonine-protein kinase BSK2 n=1 Tax=Spinacia oleracea TaxID=3562 RepID=A0ABM3QP55_SPIOL|nr:serine/threonine-protein kinase BSK2-like [Spinacia oleracea]